MGWDWIPQCHIRVRRPDADTAYRSAVTSGRDETADPGVTNIVLRRGDARVESSGYPLLFGESGAALTDADWIDHANKHLPANLSAFNATFVDGSRTQRSLRLVRARMIEARGT